MFQWQVFIQQGVEWIYRYVALKFTLQSGVKVGNGAQFGGAVLGPVWVHAVFAHR